MKLRALALFSLGLSLANSASALLYRGDIIYTVTEVSPYASGLRVGDVFTGWYSYESDTIDGAFYRDQAPPPPEQKNVLSASLFIPVDFAPAQAGGGMFIDLPGNHFSALGCELIVSGGIVSMFNWGPEFGPWAMTMSARSFAAWNMMFDDSSTRGTVVFTDPTAQVPDAGSTIGLLSLALAGLALARRLRTRA